MITIENATVTTTFNGVEYLHDFVTNITMTDPRENNLTVSPQGSGLGITYRTGTTSAMTADMVVRGLPVELVALYERAFASQERVDVMIVDARTGERYDLNSAIVRTNPVIPGSITEGETSLDQALNFAFPPKGFAYVGAGA